MSEMKEYIMQRLLEADGEYVTGSSLSKQFHVTRSAVWKEIINFRAMGFEIEAAPKKGYRIISTPNTLQPEVLKYFVKDTMWKEIIYQRTVTSTNTFLKNYENLKEGIAVFADHQTEGRGRRGKTWHSPDAGNIYLSVSFKPSLPMSEIPIMSLSAGLAVIRTIESICGIQCGIKWPNDIVANGKKLCGILCEITGEIEGGFYCIVGIGINVGNKLFPDSVSIPATSLAVEGWDAASFNHFAAALLKNLEFEYKHLDSVIDRYKEKCLTLQKEVRISDANGEYIAKAIDITAEGGLLVEREGELISIHSGEVSVRGIYGYV